MNIALEREKILSGVKQKVRGVFTDPRVDPVHDILHVQMVVRYIGQISQGEGYDPFVPELAAWLHDVGRIDEIKDRQRGENLPHAQASANRILLLLEEYRSPYLDDSTILVIQDAVARHSSLNQGDDSLVAIYLKEADRLAGLGAVGIFRNVAESARHLINLDDPFPDGPLRPSRLREPDASATEGLLFISEWHGMLRTETGKMLARPHAEIMARYLWQIACETSTQVACARNRIVQALSVDTPDIQAEINRFLLT